MVWENATRIHDFMDELGAKNTTGARITLFGWASQELEIDIKEFHQKFRKESDKSVGYQKMLKPRIESLLITLGIIFWLLWTFGSIFGFIG